MKEIELLKAIFKDSPDILEPLNEIDKEIERLKEQLNDEIEDELKQSEIMLKQHNEIERLNKNYERIYNENCKLREKHNITDISLLDENERLHSIIKEVREYIEENMKDSQLIFGLNDINRLYVKNMNDILEILDKEDNV